MSIEAELIEKIRQLPERQQVLLKSLVDELAHREPAQGEREGQHWYGALEHLGVTLSEEQLAEARREMWAAFPREIGP